MTPKLAAQRMAEIERVLMEALAIAPERRAAFLDTACGNPDIRGEVESLLDAERHAQQMFHTGAGVGPPLDSAAEIGTAGAYEILEKLGEGGMGLVFRARQTSPVKRDVALKVVHPEMASRHLVTRFLMERQAQAMMNHPNIARVLDAGETSTGLPYLAMELVAGESITDFCDRRGLDVRTRVALFVEVCEAIQHAHNKGIIHRDIKPSNVMVADCDGRALPKVIDFGIAKAVESAGPELTGATRAGLVMGTFPYMSPEQTGPAGLDLDARSDVYSLGALLYRLVCGRAPLEGLSARDASYTEILRRIREEPPAPASRVARNRALRELDWVLAKALEKDRNRRYQSADGLAQDLRRYLAGEPLEAGPPSAAYRIGKLAARFRYWVAAAAVLAAVLVAASVAMAFALRQQSRANAGARALRDVVRRIIVERPAQLALAPNRTALRGQLMRDAEGALEALSRDAAGDVDLQRELARAYLSLALAKGPYSSTGSEGDPAGAAEYIRKALAIYSELGRKMPLDVEVRRGQLEASYTDLHLLHRLGRNEEGVAAARRLEAEIGAMGAQLREKTEAPWYLSMGYVEWGLIEAALNRDAEALALHRKALATFRDGVPETWLKDSEKLCHLARLERELAITMWMGEGYSPELEATARRSVNAVAGCNEPNCRLRWAQTTGTLGEIEWASGRKEQGIDTMRRSLAAFEALAADDPANAVYANAAGLVRAYLALMLAERKATSEEAVRLAGRNLRIFEAGEGRLQKGRERRMVFAVTVGGALLGAGRLDEAIRELRAALEANRDWNANGDLKWSAWHLLVEALVREGKWVEAVEAGREARKNAWHAPSFHAQVAQALAARDFAVAVAGSKGATEALRAEAREALKACDGLDDRHAVLTGALIEHAPKTREVAELRKALERRAFE